jgi:hypothetical protein
MPTISTNLEVLADQQSPRRGNSYASLHMAEDTYDISNEGDTIAEKPGMRRTRRAGWKTFIALLNRQWDTAVAAKAAWPRAVYVLLGLLFVAIWVGIT